MTKAQALMEARAMRRTAGEIGEDVADMIATAVRLGERSDWQDARIELLESEICRWEQLQVRLIRKARALEAGFAA